MEWGRLFALVPIAYIVWWIATLLTTVIPCLNTALIDVLSLTLLQIVGVILFFTLGISGLIIAVVFAIFILQE